MNPMYRARNIEPWIQEDLNRRFVFISGPRQVGKTVTARRFIEDRGGKYYNWDSSEDRAAILKKAFLHDSYALLDEVHKYERWQNLIKGVFDKHHASLKLVVTGSSKLDLFRKGGDSLFGRYHHIPLHPFTAGELLNQPAAKPEIRLEPGPKCEGYDGLFRFGGFPEPLLRGSEDAHRRWLIERRERLIQEDVRSMTAIKLLGLLEHLMVLLPDRVGAPLSLNSLSRDLEVGFNTVKAWIESFDRLYISYRLAPYSSRITRSLKKETKLDLWDWSEIENEASRYENMVAGHLWKAVKYWRSRGYGDFHLWYLRDRDRREVDFCITLRQRPWLLIEAKLSEDVPTEPLRYFANKLSIPAIQLVHRKGVFRKTGPVVTLSADSWLTYLP
ncbi:MAG: AAA family ATPase [Pseudomonadota bacterium]